MIRADNSRKFCKFIILVNTLMIFMINLVLGQNLGSDQEQIALQIISQRFSIPINELLIVHKAMLEEDTITSFKILHVPGTQVYEVNLDTQNYEIESIIIQQILAERGGRGFIGKQERALAEAIRTGNLMEPIKVAVWLKQGLNPPRLNRDAPVESKQVQAQAIKQYYANLRKPLEEFIAHNGGKVLYGAQLAPLIFVEVPKGLVDQLEGRSDVETLYLSRQYQLALDRSARAVNADNFWSTRIIGRNIKTAVIEIDGIAYDHPYLKDGIYCKPNELFIDYHPTMVAGVIGSTHSTYRGIAFGAPAILSGNAQSLDDAEFIRCTEWAIEQGARVINYSILLDVWGQMIAMDRYLDHVVRYDGVTVVAAAGNLACNGGPGYVTSPGLGFNVLSVGAFDDRNTATNSNPGWNDDIMWDCSCWKDPASLHGDREKPELVAPGVNIISTNSSRGFSSDTGTSLAAPHVTGAAALLMEKKSDLTVWPEEVRAVLMASAVHNLEGATRLSEYDGAGGIDLALALLILNNNWSNHGTFTSSDFPISITFSALRGQRIRFAIAWDSTPELRHPPTTDFLLADLDLFIYSPNGSIVASSASYDNAYEIVDFNAPSSGTYTAQITAYRFEGSFEYLGWARLITTGQASSSVPTEAIELKIAQIQLLPNSIRQAARLVVQGQGVSGVGIEVFDLSGRKVYDSGLRPGNQLLWNLHNNQGKPLANGVYLYLVKVRGFQRELIYSEVRKLLILR